MDKDMELSQEARDLLDKDCGQYDALIEEISANDDEVFKQLYSEYALIHEFKEAIEHYAGIGIEPPNTVNEFLDLSTDHHADMAIAALTTKYGPEKESEEKLLEFGYYMEIFANAETRERYISQYKKFLRYLLTNTARIFGDMTLDQYIDRMDSGRVAFFAEMEKA